MIGTTTKTGAKVIILEDCREGAPAKNQIGTYEGDFPRTVLVKYKGEHKETMYDWFMSSEGDTWRSILTHVADMNPETIDLEHQDNWWGEWNNPRIRLDDGSVIWGDECWWKEVEAEPLNADKAREDIKTFYAILREIANE